MAVVRRAFAQHAPWLTAAVGVVIGAAKIMRVARLDPTTALGLVNAGGPLSVSLGVLVTSLSGLAGLAIIGGAGSAYLRLVNRRPDGALPVVITTALLVAVQVTPAWSFFGYLAFAAMGVAVLVLLRRSLLRRPAPAETRHMRVATRVGMVVAGLLMVVVAGSILVDDRPWIAPERLTVKGERPFTGYVVSTSDGWTTILRDQDRRLDVVPQERVLRRQPCRRHDPSGRPLGSILRPSRAPLYARCPK